VLSAILSLAAILMLAFVGKAGKGTAVENPSG